MRERITVTQSSQRPEEQFRWKRAYPDRASARRILEPLDAALVAQTGEQPCDQPGRASQLRGDAGLLRALFDRSDGRIVHGSLAFSPVMSESLVAAQSQIAFHCGSHAQTRGASRVGAKDSQCCLSAVFEQRLRRGSRRDARAIRCAGARRACGYHSMRCGAHSIVAHACRLQVNVRGHGAPAHCWRAAILWMHPEHLGAKER